ncbi:MAG: HDOD domain-containing protein, partial [Proteobacteria bacterium]|nr:HDOD domain-containing protein [Pseudomonadota bacterium]
MKILVVDDELVSRKKLQKIMDGLGECEAVESGAAAITAFKEARGSGTPFDLITLDINMPEMDGIQVLYRIREIEKNIPREKGIKIIIVTSHADKNTIVTCMQAGCDDFIVKPFDREMVIRKLEKYVGITGKKDDKEKPPETKASIGKEILSRLKRGKIDLPSLPQITVKFREMVNKGANLHEVAEFLKQDMAITSKLISVSNSAYYRGVSENKTLGQAISRLGLDTTRKYVEVISNRSLYVTTNKKFSESIEKLWEHALACAYASQIVSEILRLKLSEDAFTLGLLHDIGKLILLRIYSEFEKEIDKTEMSKSLDVYHCEFGAILLKTWEFSDRYVQIAMCHDNLEKANPVSKELLVVHFANLLVKSMGYDQGEQTEI